MPNNVHELRPRVGETEKITINLGYVDLGHHRLAGPGRLLLQPTDAIRTAIRNQLERHAEVTRQTVARKSVELGLRHYSRADLEAAKTAGEMLKIRVLGPPFGTWQNHAFSTARSLKCEITDR